MILELNAINTFEIHEPNEALERHQGRCLLNLIDENFDPKGRFEMISIITPTYLADVTNNIRSLVIKYINIRESWPIEVTNGTRVNINSYKKCKNCPVKGDQVPDMRYFIFEFEVILVSYGLN